MRFGVSWGERVGLGGWTYACACYSRVGVCRLGDGGAVERHGDVLLFSVRVVVVVSRECGCVRPACAESSCGVAKFKPQSQSRKYAQQTEGP